VEELFKGEPICITAIKGVMIWRIGAFPHRVGGPAVIYPNGDEMWYRYGLKHRVDGPAVMYEIGHNEWWFDGDQFSFREWLEKIPVPEKEKTWLILKWSEYV
jgi:hypothetical protein